MTGYRPTPLVELPRLADELGVGRVLVKDESSRLGLPSFKVLGASWAVCRALGALDPAGPVPQTLRELRELRAHVGPVTLVTATDGNHGRAVARMAALVGATVHVFVPAVAGSAAAAAIASEGAQVTVVDAPYDDAVAEAARFADAVEGLLVQDTAWPGYEEVPQWIVDGYSTLFREIDAAVADLGAPPVGLMTVPTGVGSLAQAAVVAARSSSGGSPTSLLAVEPDSAACVTTSLGLGRRVSVETGTTSMAGLNCGTPSSLAWPFLLRGLDAAVTVSDGECERAARDLAGAGVSSGPCGAASLAGLRSALLAEDGRGRVQLGLGATSTLVLLSTEGGIEASGGR